jgi:hypothetical protein
LLSYPKIKMSTNDLVQFNYHDPIISRTINFHNH